MIVRCQECQTRFKIPAEKLPPGGTLVRCSKCSSTFWLDPANPPPGTEIQAPPPAAAQAKINVGNKKLDALKDSWLDMPIPKEEEIQKYVSQAQPAPAPLNPVQDSWVELPTVSRKIEDIDDGAAGAWEEVDEDTAGSWEEAEEESAPNAFLRSTTPLFEDEEEEDDSPSILGAVVDPSNPAEAAIAAAARSSSSTPIDYSQGPEPPRIELFLTDRGQQRRQLWYTVMPLVVRGVFLVGLLVFSVWLWTSLRQGSFSLKNLSLSSFQNSLFGSGSTWQIRKLKSQVRQLNKNKKLLILRGELKNASPTRQREPDLELLGLNDKPVSLAKRLRCCARFGARQLANVKTKGQIRGLYAQFRSKKPQRRWIEAGERSKFHVVWLLRKNYRHVLLNARSTKKTTTALKSP